MTDLQQTTLLYMLGGAFAGFLAYVVWAVYHDWKEVKETQVNNKTASKPQVTFLLIEGWEEHGDLGVAALLVGVEGHPELGALAEVRTSRVEGIVYDEVGVVKEVITKNTHYIRRKEKNHG